MKTDLIDTNYVYNHRFFKIWKHYLLLYGAILIGLTMFDGVEIIKKYEFYISIFSKFFAFSAIILGFMNGWLFLRIGEVCITNEELVFELKDSKSLIELKSINEVIFGKEYGKFYYLKIQKSELIVELDKNQLKEFKSIFEKLDIEIKDRHYTDKISQWFRNLTSRIKLP